MTDERARERRDAAALIGLLELQRECTAPDLLREAQILAVISWRRQTLGQPFDWTPPPKDRLPTLGDEYVRRIAMQENERRARELEAALRAAVAAGACRYTHDLEQGGSVVYELHPWGPGWFWGREVPVWSSRAGRLYVGGRAVGRVGERW